MAVRKGFKQSEVGEIPEDWQIKTLGELGPFVTSGSRGWAAHYSDHGSPFLRITNLSRACIYPNLRDLRFVEVSPSDSEAARTKLVPGDVLISITADIGIVGYVSERIPAPAFINQHLALVRFEPGRCVPKYVSYFLASRGPQNWFRALTDAGAKAGMNLTTVRRIPVALPGELAEQAAIAAGLTSADALVESVGQLLAKKRQLKQGAMQELLQGRRRLPGFESGLGHHQTVVGLIPKDWEVRSLDSFLEIVAGRDLVRSEFSPVEGQGHPYPIFSNAHAEKGLYGYSRSFQFEGNKITVTARGDVGHAEYRSERFCSIGRLLVLSARDSFDLRFVAGVINEAVRFALESTGVPQLTAPQIAKYFIAIPPNRAEQAAIADVLSDMDAEITALEAKLAKARQLKTGMMQQLLTGKIRLV